VSGSGDEPTDAQLVAAHVAGDPDAFGMLVRRHADRLWAVALRTLGDREEAADALQDALLSAYRRAATFRGESAVTTWLHRVVVNACLDRVRRRAARPVSPLPVREIADARDDHAATDTRLDVRAALDTLPEHQRTALVLVDLHGMSVAEAAAVLDVAEGTVKSRCARGRAALVPLLAERLGAPGNRTAADGVPPAASRPMTDQRDGGRP
jgi:RNA polymerase sigma-70 factor, ECF subfamily